MHLNTLNLIGRLVADPTFKKGDREDGSNDRVWGRLAVNRPGTDQADFVPFVAWGATARAVAEHCGKGKVLILEGQLRTRSEQKADGGYDNYFECNCRAVHFGPDAKNVKASPAPAASATPSSSSGVTPEMLLHMLQQMQKTSNADKAASAASAEDPFPSVPF